MATNLYDTIPTEDEPNIYDSIPGDEPAAPAEPIQSSSPVNLVDDPIFKPRKPTTIREKFNDAMLPLTTAGRIVNSGVQDAAATLTGNPSQGGNLWEMFSSKQPIEEAPAPLPYQRNLADISKQHPAIATAGKVAGGLVESAPMLAVMPQGAVGKLIGAGFTADMISQIPEAGTILGEEMGKNPQDRDHDKITTALATIASSSVMAGAGVKHLGGEGIKKLASELKNEPLTGKEQNASAITSPEGVPQPEIRTQMGESPSLRQPGEIAGAQEGVQANAPLDQTSGGEGLKLSPEVDRFIQDFNDPAKRVTNASDDPSVTTTQNSGMGVKTLDDLKALAQLDVANKAELKAIRAKRDAGQELTPEEAKRYMELGMKVQFPREVIETATNSGSWSEENQTRVGKPLPDRPLDWKKNPEVEKWLRENGKDIGIELEEKPVESMEAFKKKIDAEKAASQEKVTLYRGQDNASAGGAYWSSDPKYAASFGGNVESVQVPKSVAEAARESFKKTGSGTPNAHILPDEWQKQAKPMEKPPEVKTHDTEIIEKPKQTPNVALEAGKESNLAADWTSATAETPPVKFKESADQGIVEYHAGIPIPKFENRKMSQLDRVTASRSAKMQASFSEAQRAQREINKVIPSKLRQGAASVYREANGDMALLKDWETNAKQKWMKDLAKEAQTITPKELAIVNKAKAAFDILEQRGNRMDVLKSHRDNYIPHVWDVSQNAKGLGLGGSSQLKQRFKFAKARTFDTFFDGDQAGFKPKTVAIGDLLPTYIHEMNRVIADRQLVQDLVKGENAKGEPLAVPRGNTKVVDGPSGQAVLAMPKALREKETADYKEMENQPALSNWTWEGKDTDGKPIFVKANLAVHPDVYRRLNSILGRSALKQWYQDKTGGISTIPKALLHGLDVSQSAMKREMFGLLAPFHQVQEGTHAVGHAVNPFSNIPKVDMRDAGQLDAARHGLMLLPDKTLASHYLEGVGAKSSFISQGLRKTGKAGETVANVIDGYQDYLFHQYIPGLKYKTYEAILQRNSKRYEKELAKGELTESDIKLLSAEQSNAAYGHLNYALLDRNPTIQHLAQLSLLAPDFLEARGRFAGQAFKGINSKVGQEQLRAVALLAVAQAGSAIVLSNLMGDKWDPKHPFEVIHNGRRYAMRSVPEDLFSLAKDTRQFIYSRVNPLTVRGGVQLATGLNYRGEKTSAGETMAELMAGYIPITARSLPGLRELTQTGRNNPVSPLEQLAGSLGLRVSRYSPISETYKLASDWQESNDIPKDKGSYPISKYQQLRYALEDGDMDRAQSEYEELKKTMLPSKIKTGLSESVSHPFTGSKANDAKFVASLKGYDWELYDLALKKRQEIISRFGNVKP